MIPMNKKNSNSRIYIQYGFIGAALGLYYGIFYQPVGEPDFYIAALLSVAAALVTVITRSWKKHFPLKKIIKDFLMILGFFLIFLLTLVFRKVAYQLGGQIAVIIETTLASIGLGLLMAARKMAAKKDK